MPACRKTTGRTQDSIIVPKCPYREVFGSRLRQTRAAWARVRIVGSNVDCVGLAVNGFLAVSHHRD